MIREKERKTDGEHSGEGARAREVVCNGRLKKEDGYLVPHEIIL